MTVFEAESLVRSWWHALAASPRSSLAEAARHTRLMHTIRGGLTETAARELYRRLGGGKERRGLSRRAESKAPLTDVPILTLLGELIDRREEYGVRRPEAGADENYSRRGRLRFVENGGHQLLSA